MYLKIAVVAVIVVAAAAYVESRVAARRYQDSSAGLEAARVASVANVAAEALDHRIDKLSDDRCSGVGREAIHANKVKPIIVPEDMAPEILSDIKLCFQRGIISPNVRDDLAAAGLLKFAEAP